MGNIKVFNKNYFICNFMLVFLSLIILVFSTAECSQFTNDTKENFPLKHFLSPINPVRDGEFSLGIEMEIYQNPLGLLPTLATRYGDSLDFLNVHPENTTQDFICKIDGKICCSSDIVYLSKKSPLNLIFEIMEWKSYAGVFAVENDINDLEVINDLFLSHIQEFYENFLPDGIVKLSSVF